MLQNGQQLLQEPVVILMVALIMVLVVGQATVNMFSSSNFSFVVREGAAVIEQDENVQQILTKTSTSFAAGANQSAMDNMFDNLQTRCDNIKKKIDLINQKIPRTINDIRVKTVSYVPWEAKENAMIQIDKVPYKFTPPNASSDDCPCNYGCQWEINLTLPIGPRGKPGQQGTQGPKGNPGPAGATGSRGPRGAWQT